MEHRANRLMVDLENEVTAMQMTIRWTSSTDLSIHQVTRERERGRDEASLLYSRRTVFESLPHLAVESPMVFVNYRVEEQP